jgi:hypothetical protein
LEVPFSPGRAYDTHVMDTGLAGRTFIVTGGNANIGRGISLAFAVQRQTAFPSEIGAAAV